MLIFLIGKEVRAHLLSYRFVLSFLLLFALIVSSVEILALNYDRQRVSYSESRRAQAEQLRESDFRSLRWGGIQVERKPNPLSVFAVGLEKEMARSVAISQFQEPRLGHSKYANPLFVLFTAPDLTYIVYVVASLLAVLFAFDAVCGESEEGTLKLILANPVPRHQVLLAKWLGGYIVLLLPFLVSVLVALLFARLTASLTFTPAEWAAFGGIVGTSALYVLVFFALGMMISTLVHRSSTSLVINFLVWVLLVLLVPNITPIVARALVPVPSTGVIAGQREAIQRAVWNQMRPRIRQAKGAEERQAVFDEIQDEIRKRTDKLMADYLQKVDRQIALGVLLSRISPAASYVYASSGLAGSGLSDFADLRRYVGRYRRAFVDKVRQIQEQRQRQAAGVSDAAERREIANAPVDPEELPVFAPGRPGWTELLVGVRTDLAILISLCGVFFLGAYAGFLRYDLMK